MVRLELAEPLDDPPAARYSDAADALAAMLADGALRRDEAPAYYLLRQRFALGGGVRTRTALLGALRLEELGGGVLPHENTAPGPKEDRLALMRAARANFSPLMMLYTDPGGVGEALASAASRAPDAEADVDGEEIALWRIGDDDGAADIGAALAAQPVYVADGHHRYETALVYRDESGAGGDDAAQFVLCALIEFDDPGLAILPYYRVVYGADAAQLAKLRELLRFYFVARPAGTPPGDASALDAVVATLGQGQTTLGVVEAGAAPQLLTPANDIIPEPDPESAPQTQARSVEAFVIQEMLLRPVFGDAFPDHVAYVHDGAEALAMVERGEGQVAFFVKGLPPDVFRSVVGAGIRLPRKSTYFHPKLPSGLAISLLEGEL